MTDAPARQDTPDNESGGPSSEQSVQQDGVQRDNVQRDGARQEHGAPAENGGQNLPVPQWSAQQPAPAPWFLGQSGPVPPGFPPPMPPPTADQAAWPNHAPGTRPEPSAGRPAQSDQEGLSSQTGQTGSSGVSGQTGQPGVSSQTGQSGDQPQSGNVPAIGPARVPGQSPGPALGPNGSPQQPPPWLDPDRYNRPGQPPNYDPRTPYRPPQPPRQPQQQPRGEEPGKRPPLSLRTRWARGLALGGAACTLITLLTGYRNFPDWLIGACAGLVMSLGGLWFGTFAQRDALRKSQRAPEAVASVVWSGISSLIALAIVSYSLIFFPQLRQYSDCMRATNTIAGQNVCQQQFENSLAALP